MGDWRIVVTAACLCVMPVFLVIVHPAPLRQAPDSATSRSVWDGVYTLEQASRGRSQYVIFCTNCHRSELQGDEMDVPGIADDRFAEKWDGRTLQDLFAIMSKTMPEIAPGSLSKAVYTDLLSYLLQANGFPSAVTALGSEPESLGRIMFERFPPNPQ